MAKGAKRGHAPPGQPEGVARQNQVSKNGHERRAGKTAPTTASQRQRRRHPAAGKLQAGSAKQYVSYIYDTDRSSEIILERVWKLRRARLWRARLEGESGRKRKLTMNLWRLANRTK